MVKSGKKKSSKKRSKAKSKKQAMRSATFAAKKLIDSAIAAGVRAQAEDAADEGDESMEQVLRNKKKSVRRAAAAAARLFEMALAEDTEGARAPADADDADGDEDNDGDDDDAEGEDAMDADDPLTSMAAQGSAFAAAAIERALKTARVEAQATALLEGMDVSRRDEPAPAPSAEPPVYLEDAFRAAGYEFVDDSPDAWAEFWADAPDVVAIDAEGTHFTPPLLLQICARGPRRRVLLVAPTGDALGDDVARLLGDASITKVFFGPPSREHLGAAIANAVDAQAFEVAATGYVGKQRGLAAVAGDALRRAPFAKRKDLQRSFGFYRSRPQFGLSHSRHWLSPEQRAYAAADAWATLALYESLAAEGHAPAREDAPATAPRGASRSPPKPPKPTKAAGLRELARARGASRSPPKPAAPAPAADFMAT